MSTESKFEGFISQAKLLGIDGEEMHRQMKAMIETISKEKGDKFCMVAEVFAAYKSVLVSMPGIARIFPGIDQLIDVTESALATACSVGDFDAEEIITASNQMLAIAEKFVTGARQQ